MLQLHRASLHEAFQLSLPLAPQELQHDVHAQNVARNFISISGCNGKTSLLKLFAQSYSPILLGTSTKMKVWNEQAELEDVAGFASCSTLGELDKLSADEKPTHLLLHGIVKQEKYSCPSPVLLQRAWETLSFCIAAFETDGSRGLALKAWGEIEPVIFPQTTHSISILPEEAFYLELSEENVCRYPLFFERYLQDYPSSHSSPRLIARILADPQGLFKNARGKRFLFINKCDDLNDYLQGQVAPITAHTLHALEAMLEELKQLDHPIPEFTLIIGSVRQACFACVDHPQLKEYLYD